MSKKRYYPSTPKSKQNDDMTPKEKTKALDTYTNVMARIGAGSDNIASMGEYSSNYITRNWRELDVLYRSNWVVKDIIDTIAEDMTKNWISISSAELNDESINKFNKYVGKIKLKESITQGLKWSRLYGGALGIIVIKGEEDMLDQPLDLDTILPGSFRGLMIFDRWRGVSPQPDVVDDFDDPDWDTPEYYSITTDTTKISRIHHSRCVRFVHNELPYYERLIEMYWGTSEIEKIYDILNCYDGTRENINALLYSANIKYVKMKLLLQRLSTGDKEQEEKAYSLLRAMNQSMSSHSLQILDQEDEFGNLTYNFAGIDDVYQTFMLDLCGAVGIPMTRLFGRSEAGLNSNGEGDLQLYYDSINQRQNTDLKPILDKLLPLLCLSIFGEIPEDIDYTFESVRLPTEDELKEQARNGMKSVVEVYNTGGISQQMFLKALKKCGDVWDDVITDQDIENADDSFEDNDMLSELMGSFGGGMNEPDTELGRQEVSGERI